MAENNSVPQVEDEAEAGGDLGSLVAQKADKAKYLVLAVLVVLIAIAALVGYMRKSAAQSAAAAKDKVFETVNVMTYGGPMNSTATLVFDIYQFGFSFYKIGYASALGVVLMGIIGICTALYFVALSKRVHYR